MLALAYVNCTPAAWFASGTVYHGRRYQNLGSWTSLRSYTIVGLSLKKRPECSFLQEITKMVFRGGELEYDNFELLRGQSHVIKVKMAGNITISCNTTLCCFFWVINSMEAYSMTLEVNMCYKGYFQGHLGN